ncbi:NADH-quinone oxidoreductase subunit D [bacterium]|nr:NADH-quinone oxidoreductase subunit D [bacterium]
MAPTEIHGDVRTEEFLLNMGPQHPSTHGVLRVVVRTDGELVLEAIPHVGYLHRCFEKCSENSTMKAVVPYTDRMDYLAAMCNNITYSLAAEKLLGWEKLIPRKTTIVRTLLFELQRIASHLMSVGTYGLDVGAITPFLHCFRERERLLEIFEEISGQRLNYSYVYPGGFQYPWPDAINKKIKAFLVYFEDRIKEYNELLSYNGIFVERTSGIGVLPPDMAADYGCTGPMLRGSGVARDLRWDQPYLVYDELKKEGVFQVRYYGDRMPNPADQMVKWELGVKGDCWSRYMVRAGELEQSRRMCLACLAKLEKLTDADKEAGAVSVIKEADKQYLAPKGQEAYFKCENPRGELAYYLVGDGKANAYRVKARAPSFNNLQVLTEISRGAMVADLVAIIGSIDIVLGEVDR